MAESELNMTAQKANHGWHGLTCCVHDGKAKAHFRKTKQHHRRRHAGWVLELAFMLVLALLLPRPAKRP